MPIIPEDESSISISQPQLRLGPVEAYAASPLTTDVNTPGIVVVHHLWGVDSQIRDVVRRFAKAGYIGIAPALYSRFDAPSGDGATDNTPFVPIAEQMVDQRHYTEDIAAAHNWIRSQAPDGKIGILGFCLGGTLALAQVVASDKYAAAVMFYGDVQAGMGARFTTPLLGNFGAQDPIIKEQDVTAMFAQLSAPHDVKIYQEAGHAFFDDTRRRYVSGAAEDAWRRTLAWFAKHLQ